MSHVVLQPVHHRYLRKPQVRSNKILLTLFKFLFALFKGSPNFLSDGGDGVDAISVTDSGRGDTDTPGRNLYFQYWDRSRTAHHRHAQQEHQGQGAQAGAGDV